MKPVYRIENWVLMPHVSRKGETYLRLEGHIKGRSPEIFETEPAHTSKVLRMVFSALGQMTPGVIPLPYAETTNSIYQLGRHRDA